MSKMVKKVFNYELENHNVVSKEKYKLKTLIDTNALINYGNYTQEILLKTNDEIIWDTNVIICSNNINFYKGVVSGKKLIITTKTDTLVKLEYVCLHEKKLAPGSGWEAML